MSRFMRIVSTLMVAVGLGFLFVYVWSLGSNRANILNQPSYYIVRSYWFVFVAGIITIIFSILGSFFSWFKAMDSVEKALPNAGYASANDINTWVGGTTADICAEIDDETEIIAESVALSENKETEILHDSDVSSEETEILVEGQDLANLKTEILREEDTL